MSYPSKEKATVAAAGNGASVGGLCLAHLLASHPGIRPWSWGSMNKLHTIDCCTEMSPPCELLTVPLCAV